MWIALYFILDKQCWLGDEPCEVSQAQKDFSSNIFYADNSGTYRSNVLTTGSEFDKVVSSLHPSLHQIGGTLNDLREFLTGLYAAAEVNIPGIGRDVSNSGLLEFSRIFREIAQDPAVANIMVQDCDHEETEEAAPDVHATTLALQHGLEQEKRKTTERDAGGRSTKRRRA